MCLVVCRRLSIESLQAVALNIARAFQAFLWRLKYFAEPAIAGKKCGGSTGIDSVRQ